MLSRVDIARVFGLAWRCEAKTIPQYVACVCGQVSRFSVLSCADIARVFGLAWRCEACVHLEDTVACCVRVRTDLAALSRTEKLCALPSVFVFRFCF